MFAWRFAMVDMPPPDKPLTVAAMRTRRLLWLFAAASLLWGGAALFGASDGAPSMPEYISYSLGGPLFGVATLATAVALLIQGARRRRETRHLIPLPVLLQSAFLVVTFVGVRFDLAFAARFSVSRGALEDAADAIRAGHRPAQPGWIGLFRMREVNTAGSAVVHNRGLLPRRLWPGVQQGG